MEPYFLIVNWGSLTQSLKNDPLKFKDKAVKSVRSKVTNIHAHLNEKKEVDVFIKELAQHIIDNYKCESYTLNKNDYNTIDGLVESKFNTWEWNFGYSPKYTLKKRIKSVSGKRFELTLFVNKGKITEANIKSNAADKNKTKKLEIALTDGLHKTESIIENTNNIFANWDEFKQEELIEALF